METEFTEGQKERIRKLLKHARDISKDFEYMEFNNMNSTIFGNEKPKFGVNWPALGNVDEKTVEKFRKELNKAVSTIAYLNGLVPDVLANKGMFTTEEY